MNNMVKTDFEPLFTPFMLKINSWADSNMDKIAYEHPAIMPEDLVRDHIKSWSNEGDLILDPFAGSGTTLKMAKLLNRNYLGIEISQEYCEIIKKRLEKYNKGEVDENGIEIQQIRDGKS